MTTKALELAGLTDRSSCLGRAYDDEPLFVLRAQDKLAPTVVRVWLAMALLHGLSWERQREVNALLQLMEVWQRSNQPSVKFPD